MGNKQTVQRQPTNSDVHFCIVSVLFQDGAQMWLGEISISSTVKQIAELVKEKRNLIGVPNIFIGYKRNNEIVRLSEEASLGDAKTAIIRVSSNGLGCVLAALNFHFTLSSLTLRTRRPRPTTYIMA